MKKFSKILLSLILVLSFSTCVDAASYPNNISASKSGTKYEYVTGLPIYYNKASSYNLYVLDANTYYSSTTSLTDPVEANEGFAYIINNGSNYTSDTTKNYYIVQAAILWYQDYLNGTDTNISSSIKSYITNNTGNTVCYYIVKLVNGAKTYGINGGSINFIDKDVTFNRSGNYYYSNLITVETNDLKSVPTVKLSNAPTNASIVNNTLVKDGRGSFQIRIPSSNFDSYNYNDFEVYISGSEYVNTVYRYTNYGMGDAIYGRSYSSTSQTVDAILPVSIDKINSSDVKVRVIDKNGNYISGISFDIYSGNCGSTTCLNSNYLQTFKSTNGYVELNKLLGSGTYTIVRKTSTSYNLPEKKVINISSLNNEVITIIEDDTDVDYDDYEDFTNKAFVIRNDLNDSNNYIKVYSNDGKLITTYKSSDTNYEIYLSAGTYYIVDSNRDLDKLYFKVTSDGLLYVKYNDSYVRADYILVNKDNDYDNYAGGYYDEDDNNTCVCIDGKCDECFNGDFGAITGDNIEVSQDVSVDVTVDWLSDVIDVPITDLSSTLKYIMGSIVLGSGLYLVYRNVKKSKNNI